MLKNYLKILLIIILSGSLLLGFFGWISANYTRSVDQSTLKTVLNKPGTLVVPATQGTSMGLDAINAITHLKTAGKLITFGTSITLAGIVDDALSMPHLNAAVGSMSIQSLFVMKSYLDVLGIVYQPKDIIKIDLGPTMFTRKSLSQEVLVSALRYADIYTVKSDYTVHKSAVGWIGSFYALNSKRIEKALTTLSVQLTKGSTDSIYATQTISFDQYHKLLDFSANNTELLKIFIDRFSGKNVVIDLMFMIPTLQNSQAGVLFNDYVDHELIPYLNSKGIPYLDHRVIYTTDNFADSTHLNGPTRLAYTHLLNEELKAVVQ